MQRVVVDPEVPRDVADLFRQNGPLLSRLRTMRPPRNQDDARVPGILVGIFGGTVALAGGGLLALGAPLSAVALLLTPLIGLYLVILGVVYLVRLTTRSPGLITPGARTGRLKNLRAFSWDPVPL
ncbi:hypothetical protein, partial [Streptosporangium sp. NPDC048865]|uniref:hypothetical protein n=1 Tax=Streptosporangium sp. NPDC048865 TaxID=3155766 RepID=UPI003413D779